MDLQQILDQPVPGNSPVFKVYSGFNSPRLEYVCGFIFNTVLRCNFRITGDEQAFRAETGFRINYSEKQLPGLSLRPHGLISGRGVEKPEVDLQPSGDSFQLIIDHRPADLFSAVFYFISRYEEWQAFTPDAHGRFEAGQSLAGKKGWLLFPVVDIMIAAFKKQLSAEFQDLELPPEHMRVVSTIDVDNLYAYKGKGLLRTTGGFFKDVVRRDFRNFKRRMGVLTGKAADPFDVYEQVADFCALYKIPVLWFFLMRGDTRYDRNVTSVKQLRRVILSLQEKRNGIGLHPSYYSFKDKTRMEAEISRLSALCGKVKYSRQHYLRFSITETPRYLMESGITADFTMGFASRAGFRAGTSFPFRYYSLTEEKVTPLLFVPFCFMDGAYSLYGKEDVSHAFNELKQMADWIQQTGGWFISVYHERSFDDLLYPDFGQLYERIHLYVKQLAGE
jgi:hypothetical protein